MISFLVFIILFGIGILGIFITIDCFDYLQKFEHEQWERLTYKRPFGISRQDFLIHPIKPIKFFIFILSIDKWDDENIPAYKNKLRLILLSFIIFLGVSFFVS